MIILFKTKKLAKTCNHKKQATRTYGPELADILMRRLDELRAAARLADMRTLPQARCHELKGNRKGQLSVDLRGPYRLVFKPADDPIPKKRDRGLDWGRVETIKVIDVEDTHD